ncbi:MAG: hypothetical protein GXO18_06445 [Aquificae bacterium]|nr:hypothetical protein [Aquificota bacterium]
MRFFISSNIKNNKPLYITVVFFLLSALLFWFISWLFYHYKFGLTYQKAFAYFFTDPEFPEKLPLGQLLEDIHIQLFLQITYILVLASIFLHKCIREKVKIFLIAISFTTLFADITLSFAVYYLSPLFIYPKILSFILFQLSTGAMIALSLKLYLSKEKEEPPERTILYALVFIFVSSSVLFAVLNFFLFLVKLGMTPDGVAQYYLGNPQKFIRPKTLEGMLSVISPHIIAMSIYLFTLVHFAFFTNIKRKTILSLLTLSFALLDNFGGLLIRYVDQSFAYIKLLSFLGLTTLMIYLSVAVAISIIRHRAKGIVLL